jgi:acyl-CoA synthetase (AMP-forming)/AMP-acid ligase II
VSTFAAKAFGRLRELAETRPDDVFLTIHRSRDSPREVTYGDLLRSTYAVAHGLRDRGVGVGDRVLLALTNDESFVSAVLACLAIGAIAVPCPVPRSRRGSAVQHRLAVIAADCAPTMLVTSRSWLSALLEVGSSPSVVRTVSWETLRDTHDVPLPESGRGEVAILQYTSGSTSSPKGVVLTHRSLRENCRQAAAAYSEGPQDVAVGWVPLYHDMGLVTGLMRPLFGGYRSVLLRPEDFAAAPMTWLRAVHAHRGTLSSAPNFAYDLCVRKIDAAAAATLDLRSWRVARNAGEMIRPDTLDRFARHFAAAGFAPAAACPSYGLAEATLTVTTATPERPALRAVVRVSDIRRGQVHPEPFPSGTPLAGHRVLVSSGPPLPDTRVEVIADGEPGTAPEGAIGRVAVRGPQVSPGYWTGTTEVPADRLITRDLGFLYAGHLFVLGRADEVLVIQGRNIYMSDITHVCAGVPGLRPGRVAAFTAAAKFPPKAPSGIGPEHDPESPEDVVWLVAETSHDADRDPESVRRLAMEVRRALADHLDLLVPRVHLVPPGELSVTTSGKVQVWDTRRRMLSGDLLALPATTAPEQVAPIADGRAST